MHNRPTPSLPRPALGDLSARANLSAARRRVLEVVEASNDAMTAVQVASALNLHHNTVREHLDALYQGKRPSRLRIALSTKL